MLLLLRLLPTLMAMMRRHRRCGTLGQLRVLNHRFGEQIGAQSPCAKRGLHAAVAAAAIVLAATIVRAEEVGGERHGRLTRLAGEIFDTRVMIESLQLRAQQRPRVY